MEKKLTVGNIILYFAHLVFLTQLLLTAPFWKYLECSAVMWANNRQVVFLIDTGVENLCVSISVAILNGWFWFSTFDLRIGWLNPTKNVEVVELLIMITCMMKYMDRAWRGSFKSFPNLSSLIQSACVYRCG